MSYLDEINKQIIERDVIRDNLIAVANKLQQRIDELEAEVAQSKADYQVIVALNDSFVVSNANMGNKIRELKAEGAKANDRLNWMRTHLPFIYNRTPWYEEDGFPLEEIDRQLAAVKATQKG